MGNKQQKTKKVPENENTKSEEENIEESSTPIQNKKENKENIIWLDRNVNNPENMFYQKLIIEKIRFTLSSILTFTDVKDCISMLKTIKFEKTYLIISGSASKDFFVEFENVIGEMKVNPIIIIFTSTSKLKLIKQNILSLNKFSLFDINLVFDTFDKVIDKFESQNEYSPNFIEPLPYEPDENCFSFEYIGESKDLIFPLCFMEFMDNPKKNEIIEFNHFLLNKYSSNNEMKALIEQLLVDVKIPVQIVVKFWLRAYTLESNFFREMNYSLERKLGNDFDIYIKAVYQGLLTKSIKPLIEEKLYRGAKINKKEIDFINDSLKNKKENLPGCICYNKAFLSSSLDKKLALGFMLGKKPNLNENEELVLYVFEKGKELDKENATNADVQSISFYNEKEILFFPFSCFEITGIENENHGGIKYYCVNLSYTGKYKSVINKSEKIPETNFAKAMLESNIVDKIDMNKDSNKNKFDFSIDKYIASEQKKSSIIAVYDIPLEDLKKKIQLLNCGDNNKNEIEAKCSIYLNNKKIDFSFEYVFDNAGIYEFTFQFQDLLTNANRLFYECNNLVSLNLEKFKTNYIKNMDDMFNGCFKLKILDLSNFKTEEVTSMKNMFKGCNSLTNLDLTSFETSNVLDMAEMFSDCSSLNFLNLSSFNTKKVSSMYRMFYNCKSLFFINLSTFESDNIKSISEMFCGCLSLNSLDLSNFEITNNIKAENMFKNCSYFDSLKNSFISEISDSDINYSIDKSSKEFLSNQSNIIKKDIKNLFQKQKNKNIDILNQSIEDLINSIKQINVMIIGETNEEKNTLIKIFEDEKKGKSDSNSKNITLLDIEGINKNNINTKLKNIGDIINETNKKIDTSFHFIWFCVSGTKIDDYLKDILDELFNKYDKRILIFIIYLKKEENDDFQKMNEYLNKIYINKKLELIPFSLKDNMLDDFINKIKNKFKDLLYQNIHENKNNCILEKVKIRIEAIEAEKNIDDLPTSVSNFFVKLLGNIKQINDYLNRYIENMLKFSKGAIDPNTINNYIEKFKKEKLKLKISGNKNKDINVQNIDDDLSKELKNIYSKISEKFYQEQFKEESFNIFVDMIKKVAETIIMESLKDLKIEEFNSIIDKIKI